MGDADSPFYVPLKFRRDVLAEFGPTSGLLVMARGLGIDSVISSLLHVFADPRLLVFVFNVENEAEEGASPFGTLETGKYIQNVGTDVSAKERLKMYGRGGVILVSPRVLLMDLLKERIPIALITGVLVNNAHQ